MTLTQKQIESRQAKPNELARKRQGLTRLEYSLAALPTKWEKEKAEKIARIEEVRAEVVRLEQELTKEN